MGSEAQPLHILFFPFMAPGHTNPMIDIAKLFTRQGVKATILTTPANAPSIQPTVDRANQQYSNIYYHHPISILTLPFPCAEAGLPDGCENFSSVPSLDLLPNFLTAISLLRQPFDRLLRQLSPDCIITDSFLPWTYTIAAERGIPRLVFHGTGFFSFCAADSLERHKPLENSPPDAESFILPGLPHRIEMLKTQIPNFTNSMPEFVVLFTQAKESEARSYGVVVNSFYEMERDYVEHYRKVMGRRAWHVGPASLCNEVDTSNENMQCLKWLDGKQEGSVVYVCFGSLCEFTNDQLREIALGLEASEKPFIWVVRSFNDDWVPDGFEERIDGRGLVIRGWAPQVLILNHQAVGGFVTHCGWNSCLEGVSAGVPLVTWPLYAEQFYNERLIVDVLRIGVSMGVKVYSERQDERAVVAAAEIANAVRLTMDGDEAAAAAAAGRKRRVGVLGDKARTAVREGGSSYTEMGSLIKELMYKRAAEEGKNRKFAVIETGKKMNSV